MTSDFNTFVAFLKSDAGADARAEIEASTSREELFATMTRIGLERGVAVSSEELDAFVAESLPARDELSERELLSVAGGNLVGRGDSSADQPPWTGGTEIPSYCPSPCFPERTTNIYCKIGDTVTGNCTIVGSCGSSGGTGVGSLAG